MISAQKIARQSLCLLLAVLICAVALFMLPLVVKKEPLKIACFGTNPFGGSKFPAGTAADIFARSHPDIPTEYINISDIDEYEEWLSAAILKGEMPDVFMLSSSAYGRLWNKGAFLDLSSDVNRLYAQGLFAHTLERSGYGGYVFAVPIAANFSMMAADNEILRTGSFGDIPPSWTWSDFQLMCRSVKYANQEDSNIFPTYGYTWEDAVYSNAGRIFDDTGANNYLNTREVINAVNYLYRLSADQDIDSATFTDVQNGLVAFSKFMAADYLNSELSEQNFTELTMPAGPQGGNISRLEYVYVCISAHSGKKKEAKDFIETLLCAQFQAELINSGYAMPVVRLDTELIRTDKAKVLYALSESIIPNAFILHRFKNDDYYYHIIDKKISEIFSNGTVISSAMSKLHVEIAELIPDR